MFYDGLVSDQAFLGNYSKSKYFLDGTKKFITQFKDMQLGE
jgi:hypothetical protein